MANSDIKIKVVFENDGYLVIEKPSGLLVHSTMYQKENTLVDWLIDQRPEISTVGENVGDPKRPGIVHRLDQDVSGLMVIAKTQDAYQGLIEQFKNSKIKKEYSAIVYGSPPQRKGIIEAPIGRTKEGRLVAVKYRKGIRLEKPAATEYEVVKSFNNFSLLKIRPLTGRTHQIRIHLKEIGCPIVGDKQHLPKHLRTRAPKHLKRIFLHASYLGFYDLNNEWREFRSGTPKEFSGFLNNFEL
jgi:23S rRNA pseudouridine1911/1915/1917 synthase